MGKDKPIYHYAYARRRKSIGKKKQRKEKKIKERKEKKIINERKEKAIRFPVRVVGPQP